MLCFAVAHTLFSRGIVLQGTAVCSAGVGTKSVALSPDGRNVLGAVVVNGGIVRFSWLGHREFLSVTSLTIFCQK